MASLIDFIPADPGRAIIGGLMAGDQREQNALNRHLAEQQSQLLQLKGEEAERQRSLQALGVMGQMLDGVDPSEMQQVYQSAKSFLGGQDFDVSDLPDILDAQTLTKLGIARTMMRQGQKPSQFGEGRRIIRTLVNPETGQEEQVPGIFTEIRNPNTEEIKSSFTPIGGEFVSTLGETGRDQTKRKIVEAGGVEGAKLDVKAIKEPKIRADIKLAEIAAQDRGEALTDLKRAEAGLPGLLEVVDDVRKLAPIATSTFGGKSFDAIIKNMGLGATKGSTARARFISLINNQILPLLKPTFGGTVSDPEREALAATMGDPDMAPGEKVAVIDEFIKAQMRKMEADARAAGIEERQKPTEEQKPPRLIFNPQTNQLE